jgi:AraC-like DNA-binding protein
MLRHRKVRFSYPEALVQLAVVVSIKSGKRAAANALGLPLSTVYRWMAKYRRMPQRYNGLDGDGRNEQLCDLIGECEAYGFNVRDNMSLFEPSLAVRRESDTYSTPEISQHPGEAKSPPARRAYHQVPGANPNVHPVERAGNSAHCATWNVSARTRKLVEQARSKIELRYYSNLSCDELSSKTGISKWHFIKSFRSMFGTSPYHYLMQVRVQQAKKLLYTTTQPLDAIATATGFDTPSCLCKAFKSVEGASLSALVRGVRMGYVPRLNHASD